MIAGAAAISLAAVTAITPAGHDAPSATGSFSRATALCEQVVLQGVKPELAAARLGLKLTPAMGGAPSSPPTRSDIFFGATTKVRVVDAFALPGGFSAFFATLSVEGDKCLAFVRVSDGGKAIDVAEHDLSGHIRLQKVAAAPAVNGEARIYSAQANGRRYVVTNSWGVNNRVTKAVISIRPE